MLPLLADAAFSPILRRNQGHTPQWSFSILSHLSSSSEVSFSKKDGSGKSAEFIRTYASLSSGGSSDFESSREADLESSTLAQEVSLSSSSLLSSSLLSSPLLSSSLLSSSSSIDGIAAGSTISPSSPSSSSLSSSSTASAYISSSRVPKGAFLTLATNWSAALKNLGAKINRAISSSCVSSRAAPPQP